jgi:glucokinase
MRLAGAVDIGATNTKIGVVGEDGSILARSTVSTQQSGASLVEAIASTLSPMLPATPEDANRVIGIGVSIAGFLDAGHTTMYENSNLPSLCGFPLRKALEARLSLPCALEVDSNAAAIAEHRFGAGKGSRRFLAITVGTGLGGAVIIDGKLLRYTGECVGDVGHIILDPDGRQCTCGSRGCLEALVCSAALSERVSGKPVRNIITQAREGHRDAVDALNETGRWLGIGLASLSSIFAPDRIVVGGGIAGANELLLDPTRASFRRHAAFGFRDSVRILGSGFDGWEGMVGAASLFLKPESQPRFPDGVQ